MPPSDPDTGPANEQRDSPGPARAVVIVAYPGVQLLDVAGPIDVFAAANAAGADYDVRLASADGRPLATGAGLGLVPDAAFAAVERAPDLLIVPGAEDWRASLTRDAVLAFLTEMVPRTGRTVTVCAGAFLLAEIGLLDGRRATTHWRLTGALRARFPRITVEDDPIFVTDGRISTSAGVTAGIDVCLSIVEADYGAELARAVARQLVVFLQRPGGQAQYSERLRARPVAHETLRRLLDAVAADPAADHRLDALAERAGFSGRQLARVFRRELDTTPAAYVEAVRVEAARELLEASSVSLDVVAARSGLGSAETLRRVFARHLGTTPAAYRHRFATTAQAAVGAVAGQT